jgi:hypothetical protein
MRELGELVADLRENGFAVSGPFFEPADVERAHEEILALRARVETKGASGAALVKAGASTEILTNLYGECPALDALVGKILADGASRALLERIGGKRFRNRDYTCRLMTGLPDAPSQYNPPLEWHRDSRGEFVIGIYLTDIPEGDNSATAFLPGSQYFPYDPRWNALLGAPFFIGGPEHRRKYGMLAGLGIFLRLNFFGRMLGRSVCGRQTGAFGKAGEFYLFINDTWHGRLANRHGRKAAVIQMGFFPSEFPFPDKREEIDALVMQKLPPAFRAALDRSQPPNSDRSALVHEILSRQQPLHAFTLFWLARIERRIAQAISEVVLLPLHMLKRAAKALLRRGARA